MVDPQVTMGFNAKSWSNLDEKWRRFQSDIMRHPEALHWPPKNGWCLGDVDPFYKIDVDPYIQKIK